MVAILAFVFGSKDSMPQNVTTVTDSTTLSDGSYGVDESASSVRWNGEYVKGPDISGTASLSSGTFVISGGVLTSGNFDIDVASVESSNPALDLALKSADILSSEAYPHVSFEISSLSANPAQASSTNKYIVSGFLTVKGVKNGISFPITLIQSGNRLKGDSSFAINRADWGIVSHADVRNAVLLDLHLEATK